MQKDQPPFDTKSCPECRGTLTSSQGDLNSNPECKTYRKTFKPLFNFQIPAPGNPPGNSPETQKPSPATERDPIMTQLIDDGCEVSRSCLKCPLPQCRYDNPVGYQAFKRNQKDQEWFKIAKEEGLSNQQAADRFGVTPRTMFRIKARAQNYINKKIALLPT